MKLNRNSDPCEAVHNVLTQIRLALAYHDKGQISKDEMNSDVLRLLAEIGRAVPTSLDSIPEGHPTINMPLYIRE